MQSTRRNRRWPRLVLNDDGSNFLAMRDNQTPADLRAYLARYAGTQVDLIAYCVTFGGGICYYDSDIGERLGTGYEVSHRVTAHRMARNLRQLREGDKDYLGLTFAALHEHGLPVVASFRMNDAHMSSDPTGPCAGRFWMDHPDWRLDRAYGYYASCMNYAIPPVRHFHQALVHEVMHRHPDLDGIELDFMRSPFFFMPGLGRTNAHLITEMVAEIRADLDRAAKRSGHDRYLLTVTVPRSPDIALNQGLDVRTWCEQRTVDLVCPGSYCAEMLIPIEQWKEQLPSETGVNAYISCSPQSGTYMSLENYRAAAANAYAAGADGIYLFNYPCFDELNGLIPRPVDAPPLPFPRFRNVCWHPDLTETRKAIRELGDPAALRGQPKHYLFYLDGPTYAHHPPAAPAIDRSAPQAVALEFRCADDPRRAAACELRIKLAPATANDRFRFSLNGRDLPESQVRWLYSPRGRDARMHSIRLEPYAEFVIRPGKGVLRKGTNALTIDVLALEQNLVGRIQPCELELRVR